MLMECLEIPQTVNNTVMNMLEENRVEKSFVKMGFGINMKNSLNSPYLIN